MNSSISHGNGQVAGWVSGPNSRGTIGIIWSSFITIFLCTWTAICLNIPHTDDTQLKILYRKAKWMFWAIVGPELVLAVAIGQFASARRSVKRFHNLGIHNWTLRHGFFADMGGILLQTKDFAPFLVNSRQLAYLVEKKYLECPKITEDEIWDKSKADTVSKILTLLQASWLMISLLGRAVLKLPTSTLELSAGAIVLCTIGTSLCWLRKPCDVKKGILIATEATTAQILIDAGAEAANPYRDTPLDFVAKESMTFGCDVMAFFGLRSDNNPERPLRQFPNDRFPDISTFEKFSLFCITSAFGGFHLIGWNFIFPTRSELLLWRISSSIVTGVTVFFWLVETIAARHRFGRWEKYLVWLRLKTPLPEQALTSVDSASDLEGGVNRRHTIRRMDEFEKLQKKAKPILIWEVGLIIPIVMLYAVARAYMVFEAFASLRKLPVGVFQTVGIVDSIPHWG